MAIEVGNLNFSDEVAITSGTESRISAFTSPVQTRSWQLRCAGTFRPAKNRDLASQKDLKLCGKRGESQKRSMSARVKMNNQI